MRAVIEALQALRGIALVSAVTIVAEVGELSRFAQAPTADGLQRRWARARIPAATRTRRGGITKTGNAHLRRIVIEAAWAYRHRPAVGAALRKRQATLSDGGESDRLEGAAPVARAATARCSARGKCQQQVVTAVGRELLGFIWAIGVARGSRHGRRATDRGVARGRRTGNAATVAVEGHTERRILERSMRRASGLEPALLVRGSSRRITIMRFRPANIRVINRRDSRLDRLRCCFRNRSKITLT